MARYILFNKNTWQWNTKDVLFSLVAMLIAAGLTTIVQVAFGWPPGAAFLFVGVVFSALAGGVWPGLIATGIMYAYLSLSGDFEFFRVVYIIGGGVVCTLGITVGRWYRIYLQRIEREFDTVNGNLKRLDRAIEVTRDLIVNFQHYDDHLRLEKLQEINDIQGNLATLARGWDQLYREMVEVKQRAERGFVKVNKEE